MTLVVLARHCLKECEEAEEERAACGYPDAVAGEGQLHLRGLENLRKLSSENLARASLWTDNERTNSLLECQRVLKTFSPQFTLALANRRKSESP